MAGTLEVPKPMPCVIDLPEEIRARSAHAVQRMIAIG